MQSTIKRGLSAAVTGAWLAAAAAAGAQGDKLAQCPDPEAARKYVQQCLQANPYNTKEICEERALEALCGGKN